ncbi:hypothetical protein C8C99_1506 [Acidovorax sp. 107]|uniref:hypothetical protein n=1 Tax=Acidovorax sp. FJL06 TaxID=2153365 RepID=UPI000D3F8443|nr:hypothetical protein [Acidovorax sp. FJL06]PUA96674.1 hypothetical protein C8C99_1506 [Acidovorax sp. 107]RQO82931.1 hypothetical protein DBV10_05510 [Acidovorax sp. FJL06]
MQSMRRRVRLAPSLVVVSLAVLGLAGSLAGCQRKEAEVQAPELPVQTVSGFLEIAGVLDRRGEQGAVFEVSPETGDLVAFVFDPKSALGQRLLSQCVQNMPCLVEGVRARPLDSQAPATKVLGELGFSVSPSAWLGMIDAGDARVESALEEPEMQVKTRFGVVAVQEGDSSVVLNGQTVLSPQEESVRIVRNAPVGAEDVLLLQSGSGTACPALFQVLAVSAQGVQVSPKFGSCSDRVFAVVEDKPNMAPKLSIRMLGFAGPFEPEEEQRKAAQKLVEFVYQQGSLTRDGKPVTSQ